MKDYYIILGIPEDSSEADIKKAFRKLAFQYHPDKNPGHEKEAEAKFKEINEAFGVLGDKDRRQQYDLARGGQFVGAGYGSGYPGFQYSQQDIFNGIFNNRNMFNEMNRMFAQAGLRFDEDFLNRVFFSGRGFTFQFFTTREGTPGGIYGNSAAYQQYPNMTTRQPGWLERQISRMVAWIGKLVMSRLFNVRYEALPGQDLDFHSTLALTPAEAAAGGEKQITYRRDGQAKNLVVKVPSGVKAGTRIRLKGMGMVDGKKSGDLYLHVKIEG